MRLIRICCETDTAGNKGAFSPIYLGCFVIEISVENQKMNEPQRPRRETSDFSIARILSKDFSASSIAPSTCSVQAKDDQKTEGNSNYCILYAEYKRLDWFERFCTVNRKPEYPEMRLAHVDAVQNVDSGNDEPSWLRCTRYKPPKLSRRSCTGKSIKRRPGSHPRIPFTKFQLQLLEEKYKGNAYLSRRDVIQLSGILHLPQSRVSIR